MRSLVACFITLLLCAGAAVAFGGGPEVVGENLVVNGSFEDGTAGWSSGLEVVGDGAYEGAHYGVIDNTVDGQNKAAVQGFVPLKPFTYYEFRMAARRETGEGYFYVHCNWFAAPGERLMSSPQWGAGRAQPVILRTGEGRGQWREYSGIFRSNRADLGGVQIVLLQRDGADRVSFDAISIREVRYPEAPPWDLPEAVVFEGHPSRFGMALESAAQDGQRFTITTTGARYVLDADAGTMTCGQRIGAEREVVTADFGGPLGPLQIVHQDSEVCVLQGDDLAIGFQGDSLVTIATNRPLTATLISAIGAEWFRMQEPHLLAIDQQGGWCVTPWSRPELQSPGTTVAPPEQDTADAGWNATWEVGARELFALAVFPSREFNWEESFEKRIVCTTVRPAERYQLDDDALREYSKHATVLMLFAGIYSPAPQRYEHAPYNVGNPASLDNTIALARELGMESIIYRHPTSYEWVGLDLDYFLEDLRVTRARYGFDGWYFDGYPGAALGEDWLAAWRAMRIVRDRVGDATIYVHCTLNPPVRMTEIYCPFIDSYATFLLRAEAQFIDGPTDPYLRYVLNTQHISNSIATLKGNEMRESAGSEEKASLRLQLETMLSLNGRCRWAYPGWPLNQSDLNDYIEYYYAELARMEAQWRETGEPIPMTWPPQ